MENDIEINRGASEDFEAHFTSVDENGTESQIDLTGATIELFEPHALLEENITLDCPDPTSGIVLCNLQWDDAMLNGRHMSFRVRAVFSPDNILSSQKLVVYVV